MSSAEYTALAPLALLTLAPLVVMLTIAVRRRHSACLWITVAALAITLVLVWRAGGNEPVQITQLLLIDRFALFYIALTVTIAGVVVILGLPYMAREESQPEEYYVLMLLATAGASVMSASTHFASFYLGLEILSVAQYSLVAYVRRDRRGTEAAMKYLVLAAASAAFILFGMALVYAELGTMEFDALAHANAEQTSNHVILLGVAMMLAGIGFKLSIAPFHMWTPDVYEGAPTPVTAFISTASKIGVLAVMVRYFALGDAPVSQAVQAFVAVTAAASMIVGNVLALVQTNIKRLLAYSSVAHMGYLSVAFLAGGASASDAVTIYIVAYSAASLGAFGVVMTLSRHTHGKPSMEHIDEYRGLFWSHPSLAAVLGISLLSLTGIPLTAGFIAKVYVIVAGAETAHWPLLITLAVTSVVGVYYYLRIVVFMFARTDAPAREQLTVHTTVVGTGMLVTTAIISLALGIFPGTLLTIIHSIAPY